MLTGGVLGGLQSSMVLFHPKGKPFDKAAMWDAIMSRRAVGVAPQGVILGPDRFRKAMQLLLLDREYLEGYRNRVRTALKCEDVPPYMMGVSPVTGRAVPERFED